MMYYTRLYSLVDDSIFTGLIEFQENDTTTSQVTTPIRTNYNNTPTTMFKIFIMLIVFDELYRCRYIPLRVADCSKILITSAKTYRIIILK